ncbi:DUF1611 domain-containing protein [Sphingosinicella microcystinivorans]|nr:DUF1611 domain-containing protein [Sphingosinicella microcystinivorans]BBE34002.1 hypothetical protein SmB9_16600 [Sphingosinicella microcystinivorans]
MLTIKKPFLLIIGDMTNPRNAKTAFGLRDWARADCLGQLRFAEDAVDIGLPSMTVPQAAAEGVKTAVIGIAPHGGVLPAHWVPILQDVLRAGIDIASGLHSRLKDIPEIADLAASLGRTLHDVRHTTLALPVGNGKPRAGRRLLTVGTDCALGKKYTAMAIAKGMNARGLKADFRATGQTGILIAGGGIAIDAVVADFISGAAEMLSPENDPDHWDVIEGQGAILHPAYAPVTLGLLYGSQPDALILCDDPLRERLNDFPHVPCPTLQEAMDAYLPLAHAVNPAARFVGISLNTSSMSESEAFATIARTAEETGLACFDPIRTGVDAVVDVLADFAGVHATESKTQKIQ